jgi:glycosyltransferase involved in cell wall biosynthesis
LKNRKVLVMVDWYAPGFKAGGPIRSAVNFADQLEKELDIYVLTTDRDLGDQKPYSNIKADQWTRRSEHQVFYASPSSLSWASIRKIILDIAPDHIYLNSMFSRYFAIYPLLMKRMGLLNGKLVLAPRGMLRESALAHKSTKKKVFINIFKTFGLSRNITFHATDDTEKRDIINVLGNEVRLFKAGNMPGRQKPLQPVSGKIPGFLKMVFVGRIHPIKNLDFLLRALLIVEGKVELTVIATLEDQEYWRTCQLLIEQLPKEIQVRLMENVAHEKIEEIIQSNHLFVLPTKGENFGHAIFEALSAGRPVLISDQTPWRHLEKKKAGWDLTIEDGKAFTNVIDILIKMDQVQLDEWSNGAWILAKQYAEESETRKAMLKIFN